MPPSFQFSWCWGSQLKPPSQECSLLAPQQGAVAPVEMSLEERGEALGGTLVRHKALGVCSGTFHSNSQLRKSTSLKAARL